MNPYDFVPVEDFNTPPVRKKPVWHHKFEGLAGQIDCALTAETLIFIPLAGAIEPKRFITRDRLPIIPGSSLKGLFRNLVETVANGCFLLFDETYERNRVRYENKLPDDFKKCKRNTKLCIACRMFGMLERGEVFQGNVSIGDAVTEDGKYTEHEQIYTKALMEPKPRHDAFYLDASGHYIAGRKFYFHSPQGIYTDRKKSDYNQYIRPLDKGSQFSFSMHFTNLQQDELAALLYALALEPRMRHKIGLAKPIGLGSVKIEVNAITLIDYKQRYTAQGKPEILSGSACDAYITKQIAPYTSNITSKTLNALRRIWNWDANNPINYIYPDQRWFGNNSQKPISATP